MGKKSVFAGMSWEDITNEYGDCPEKLFGLAKTDFEKAVAVEFFIVHKKIDERFGKVEKDISWCKWLITGIFSIVALGTLATYIPRLLLAFGFV